jgi:hypothetical protein
MISRSDWEPLPKPTLSPFAPGYLSLRRFFTAAMWCVPALRVPLVHSQIKTTFDKTPCRSCVRASLGRGVVVVQGAPVTSVTVVSYKNLFCTVTLLLRGVAALRRGGMMA